MKQLLKKILKAVVIMVGIYYGLALYRYVSLDNVFLEIQESKDKKFDTKSFSLLSKVLGTSEQFRNGPWHADDAKSLPFVIKELADNESVEVIVGIRDALTVKFSKELKPNEFLHITYVYWEHKLLESIEISDSNESLYGIKGWFYANPYTTIDRKINMSYQKRSSKGLPSLYLTNSDEILAYLKPYNIDTEWLKAKADFILKDQLLTRWFKEGSRHYSFENLGNVEIVRDKLFD